MFVKHTLDRNVLLEMGEDLALLPSILLTNINIHTHLMLTYIYIYTHITLNISSTSNISFKMDKFYYTLIRYINVKI